MIRVPPPQPAPRQPVDASDVSVMQRAMLDAAEELTQMAGDVASALTVIEYDGERRKRSLALIVREFLATGDSASAADTKGRASEAYGEALVKLAGQLEAAHDTKARHEAAKLRWETARSCLAMSRATIGNL
jgi:hypothetical protein